MKNRYLIIIIFLSVYHLQINSQHSLLPNKIPSPLVGEVHVSLSETKCLFSGVPQRSLTEWCFSAWAQDGYTCDDHCKCPTIQCGAHVCSHCNFGLLGQTISTDQGQILFDQDDDNWAYDCNLSSNVEENKHYIYPIANGIISRFRPSYGGIYLRHKLPGEGFYYSSYLHGNNLSNEYFDETGSDDLILSNLRSDKYSYLDADNSKEGFQLKKRFTQKDELLKLSNKATESNHLHFGLYLEHKEGNSTFLKSYPATWISNCIVPHFGNIINAGLSSAPNKIRVYFKIPPNYSPYLQNITTVQNVKIGNDGPYYGSMSDPDKHLVQSAQVYQNEIGYYFDILIPSHRFVQGEYYDLYFEIGANYPQSEVVGTLSAFGARQIYFAPCPINIDDEPNSSIDLASRITPDFITNDISLFFSGNLFSNFESDFYQLNIEHEGRLSLLLSSSDVDVNFEIYDEDEKYIGGSYDIFTSNKLVQKSVLKKGVYYIKIVDVAQNEICPTYTMNVDWSPDIQICLSDELISTKLNSDSKQLNCPNCNSFTLHPFTSKSNFDGNLYDLKAYLTSTNSSKYYDVYAVDENGIVGTTHANISPKSSAQGEYNVTLKNIPCGTSIVVRAEQSDDPYDCFQETSMSTPSCQSSNKTISMSWPGVEGECFETGESKTIVWNSNNVNRVNIKLCPAGGSCYFIARNIPNNNYFQWTVNGGTTSYYIKVEDAINEDIICDNGYYFGITDDCNSTSCDPPQVTLITPPHQESYASDYPLYIKFDRGSISEICQFSNYEIQISTSSAFPQPSTSTLEYSTEQTSFGPISGLQERRYYWKVRSINEIGTEGNWSNVFYFDISSSAPKFNFSNPRVCLNTQLDAQSLCNSNQTSFSTSETISASCQVQEIREKMRVEIVWSLNGQEIFREKSNWKSEGLLTFSSSLSLVKNGSYNARFYRITDITNTLLSTKSFNVSAPVQTNTFGDFELNDAYSDDAVNGVLTVQQGQQFTVRIVGEFDGNLSPFPNRELEVETGFFLKRLRSSNISSGWYKYLGSEPLSFRCPSYTSLCNRVWDDSNSRRLTIPFDVEPGTYYVLCYMDYADEFNESNETDNHEYFQVIVTPYCEDIFPIYETQEKTTSVVLSWEENSNVTNTNLRYRIQNTDEWTTVENFLNGSTLRELPPCFTIEQQIQSECNGTFSNWSRSNYFSTACEIPCLPPSGRYESPNYTSCQVFWADLEDVYLYEVRSRKVGDLVWTYEGLDDCCYENITGLESGAQYEWQIRTVCPGPEYSSWSGLRTFTTLTSCTDRIMNGLETGIDCGGHCAPCNCQKEYHIVSDDITIDDSLALRISIIAESHIMNNSVFQVTAGQTVELKSGFSVMHGSVFKANIATCND